MGVHGVWRGLRRRCPQAEARHLLQDPHLGDQPRVHRVHGLGHELAGPAHQEHRLQVQVQAKDQAHHPRLDQEHVNLFVAMYNVENDLTNQDKVDHLMKIMREHFYYEEAQFCDAHDLPWDYCKEHKKKHSDFSERFVRMYAPVDLGEIKWAQDWLAQHIKNTDFGYKGSLKHETPEPYVWDESFK